MPHPVQRIAVTTGDMDTMLASINDGRGTTPTASFDARTAAVTRLFADPLLAAKNRDGGFWDGHTLAAARLHEALASWSSGERLLALAALDLWGYRHPGMQSASLRLGELFQGLDWTRVRALLEALALSAAWMAPGDRLTVDAAADMA